MFDVWLSFTENFSLRVFVIKMQENLNVNLWVKDWYGILRKFFMYNCESLDFKKRLAWWLRYYYFFLKKISMTMMAPHFSMSIVNCENLVSEIFFIITCVWDIFTPYLTSLLSCLLNHLCSRYRFKKKKSIITWKL